jgi:hypothetical protein
MPRKSEARIDAIQMSVMPALRLRGSLNAVIPFESASTPVSAGGAARERRAAPGTS